MDTRSTLTYKARSLRVASRNNVPRNSVWEHDGTAFAGTRHPDIRAGSHHAAIRSEAQVAQLVEQGIENPCVGSSILSLGTTPKN